MTPRLTFHIGVKQERLNCSNSEPLPEINRKAVIAAVASIPSSGNPRKPRWVRGRPGIGLAARTCTMTLLLWLGSASQLRSVPWNPASSCPVDPRPGCILDQDRDPELVRPSDDRPLWHAGSQPARVSICIFCQRAHSGLPRCVLRQAHTARFGVLSRKLIQVSR